MEDNTPGAQRHVYDGAPETVHGNPNTERTARSVSATILDPGRLDALRRLNLLDTPPENAFDRLTRLATRVLRVPVSLVSLVDADRQFFKSSTGLGQDISQRQTPLSHSFCQHTVASGEPLIVRDARAHALVRDNLAISEMGVVAYAGIPLITSEGHVLGSFCAIDTQPRQWSDDDVALLTDLAAAVMTEIELSAALHAAESAAARMRQLQSVTAALSAALTPNEVADVILRHGLVALGAAAGSVALYDEAGKGVRIAAATGYDSGAVEAFQWFSIDVPLPLAEVIRTGEPVYLESNEAWAARYPGAAVHVATGYGAAAAAPLAVQGRVVGALGLSFATQRVFDAEDRGYLATLAHQCAQALERTRLLEAERAALVAAEFERRRLREVLEQAPALIAVLAGPTHVVEFANAAFQQVMGRTGEALLGQQVGVVFPELAKQGVTERLGAVLRTGQPFATANLPLLLHHAGEGGANAVYLNTVYQPLRDAAGTITGILLHAVDVTEEVRARRHGEDLAARLRRQLALTRALTASLGEGVYALDREGQLIVMNPAAETMLGWTEDELRGRNIHQAIHYQRADRTPLSEAECPLLSVIASGATVRQEDDVFTRKDGALLPVAYTSSPMTLEGEVVGAVLTFRDISARRALEHAREEFLSSAVHDLKTPLTTISGRVQLARRQARRTGEGADRGVDDHLLRIEQATTRMVDLIDDLASVAHARMSGAPTPERYRTDLVALVQGVVAQQKGLTAHHMRLEVPPGPLEALVTPADLERAVGNLLANAVKYSPEGGEILVRLREENGETGPGASLAIQDHGMGIPAADLPSIFHRFHRASNVAGIVPGTGIGLASAQSIIKGHGGVITAQSVEGQGATFTIWLPLAPSPDADTSVGAAAP